MRTQAVIGTVVFGLLATASVTGFRPTAHACSPLPATCKPPVRLFPVDEVPGDHIFFKTLVDAPGELSLRDANGRLIEADVRMIGGDRVFAPSAPVAAGQTLTLSYTTVCPGNAATSLSPSKQTYTFKTYTDMASPGFTPAIGLSEIGTAWPGTPNAERFVRLGYDSLAGSAQHHLEDVFVTVDGKSYALNRSTFAVELRSRCNQPEKDAIDSCGAVWSYAAGKHEVEIWSTIVGAGEQPHAKLTVELTRESAPSAGADAGAPCTQVGAKASDESAAQDESAQQVADTRSDDGLPAQDEGTTDAIRARSNGCALANDASSTHALFVFGSIVALITRRRRRAH